MSGMTDAGCTLCDDCGTHLTFVRIDGPEHSSDFEIDTVDLCTCGECGAWFIRRVLCERYDMSGDRDEYQVTLSPVGREDVVGLLIALEEDLTRKPTAASDSGMYRGRVFAGALAFAEEHSDLDLLELVRRPSRGIRCHDS